MKKTLLVALTLILLATVGFFALKWWKQQNLNMWSFVPDNSIMVFQPLEISAIWSGNEELKILKNIKSIPQLDSMQSTVSSVDSLLNGKLLDAVDQTKLLISFHQNTNESLAALYIMASDPKTNKAFSNLFTLLQDSFGFKKSERRYQKFVIIELKHGQTQLAYFFHQGFIVASFSPFLVEDAIRMIVNDKPNAYTGIQASMSQIEPATGAGRVFVNTDLLDKLARIFAAPLVADTAPFKWLTHLMYLDLSMSDEKIDLAGFSINDTSRVNYLSAFDGVRGIGFEMKNIIPASASYVVHHSFDDVEKWHRGLKNYWRKHEPAQLTRIGEIENKYQFNIQDFYGMIANEVGLFYIASNRPKYPDKILCIQHKEQQLADQVWGNLSIKTNTDSLRYHEGYQGRDIYKINIDELPSRIFGDLFNGFEASFYFIDNEFVYFGNSQKALEVMIDAVDNENTWRKSVKTNDFLESTNDDANFSIYIKTSGLIDMLSYQVNDSWAEFMDENQHVLQQIEYGVIQFTNVDDTYYTNISINHPGELIEQIEIAQFKLESSVEFESNLISKPFGVRNHNDKSLEIMVQDEKFNLHLISKSQEVVLSIPLDGPLTSKVYQLDYYKNGKLQYLFSLGQSVHLIDRTGTYIPGFPKSVTLSGELVALSMFDYDKSRNYRLLVGDESGKFRMMDKSGKTLKGWKSKQMLGKPAMKAVHIRIGKTDVLLFPLKNGIMQVLNRKGDSKKGFPIDLNGDFTNEVYIEKGPSLAKSFVTTVSDLGELVTFNFEGNITNRDQILRESSDGKFKMVIANNKKSYVIVKEESSQISFYDQSLEEFLVIPKPSDNMQYQYYKFDVDHQLIIVHDHDNQKSSLYDRGGRLLHQMPLGANARLAVVNQAAQGIYQVFVSVGTELNVLLLSRQ